jgi:hypothetical protein
MSLLPFHGFAFFSGSLSHHRLSKILVAHYHIKGVIQELFEKCLIITLYLFSLLKKVGLGCSVFL